MGWIKRILLIAVSFFLIHPLIIWAQQEPDATLVNQLMMKIQERDQVIEDLQRRVQQLEQRVGGGQQRSEPALAAQSPEEPAATPATATASTEKAVADQPIQHVQTQAEGAAPETPPAAVAQRKAAPGSFEVDEEAAERALERTLVQTGALLLPFGQAEIQPFVTYARIENEQPVLLRDELGNIAAVANIQRRRNDIETGVFFRLGLPFGTQAELSIPARVINQSDVVGIVNQETENTTHMLSDIRVGLAKTLLRETTWLPDIVGRITWDTDTGKQTLNGASFGSAGTGFNELIFSATALKRQDPLAFTGTFSYRKTFKKNDIEPGDVYSLALSATLAASPQTSLSMGLQQSFIDHTKIFNSSIPGTDVINSVFTLGASSIIGRRIFFSTLAGIGLTKNAPDYFISVAIPIRFDVPFNQMLRSN